MDKDELIFNEYKLYTEQKDAFIDRIFNTNKFYMTAFVVIIFATIFTGDVVFMNSISATFIFGLFGTATCILWWMNVDSYNTLIKIKYSSVIEELEKKLPVQPYSEESKGIVKFRKKKIFVYSDIQKLTSVLGALFFFAVFVSELTPIIVSIYTKLCTVLGCTNGGI